jgi:hypothetical protein
MSTIKEKIIWLKTNLFEGQMFQDISKYSVLQALVGLGMAKGIAAVALVSIVSFAISEIYFYAVYGGGKSTMEFEGSKVTIVALEEKAEEIGLSETEIDAEIDRTYAELRGTDAAEDSEILVKTAMINLIIAKEFPEQSNILKQAGKEYGSIMHNINDKEEKLAEANSKINGLVEQGKISSADKLAEECIELSYDLDEIYKELEKNLEITEEALSKASNTSQGMPGRVEPPKISQYFICSSFNCGEIGMDTSGKYWGRTEECCKPVNIQKIKERLDGLALNQGKHRELLESLSEPKSLALLDKPRKNSIQSRSRSRGRGKSQSQGRSRSQSRSRSRGRGKSQSQGRSRSQSRSSGRGKSQSQSRGKSQSQSRGKSQSQSRGKSHSRGGGRRRRRGKSQSRSKSQGRLS